VDSIALLADLDADQRHAVATESRLVAVVAGAGSGKTRVLTRRVAYRIATGTADAAHTVVLTFTREAAGELRRRLPRLGLTDRVNAGTFHSVAHGLLRQRWSDHDQRPRSIVTDRRRLVGDVMGPSQLDELVDEMNWATARGFDGGAYVSACRSGERRPPFAPDRVAGALAKYVAEKRRRGVVDLDDLLSLTNDAIAHDPDFAATVRWRFRHVLVDEAQDLNPLQHRLIDLLRAGTDDLFLVGDPAQAIYGFNGSDPSLLIDVSERFPGIEIIRLPVNHRCTPQVVEAGAFALRVGRQPSDIRSARPDGPSITVEAHDDERAEAATVASRIARLDPTLVRSGDVAVLARTHAALGPIRSSLDKSGVAVRRIVDGAGSPLATHLRDAYRVQSADRMRRWAHDHTERARDDGDESLAEVARAATDFLRDQPTGDGAAFQAWVRSTDPFGEQTPGVNVLTFHGAKGREWHSVFLIGCETSLVPHRSASTVTARAEEARLLYVALTRAADELSVNWARRRGGYQRELTPLLDGFVSEPPVTAPPPAELLPAAPVERDLALQRLEEWRDATARAGRILPDAVCSHHALSVIAARPPSSPEQLDAVTGLGALTAARLFGGIRAALDGAGEPSVS